MNVRRVTRREVMWAWAGSFAVSAGFLGLAAVFGVLGIARNDDWSFIQNAFQMHSSGIFAVAGWVQMTLIGQLVLAWPVLTVFGDSLVALQFLVAGLGAVLLACSYLFARSMLNRPWSLVVALSVAASPMFGSLSASFMTDVPAAALQVLALLLAVVALRKAPARRAILIVASLVALYAFGIREYSIAALAAIWLIALLGRRRWSISGTLFGVWTAGLALAGLAIVLWRAGQTTENSSTFGFTAMGLEFISWLPLTIGTFLIPVTAFLSPGRVLTAAWRSSRWFTAGALVLVTGLMAHTRLSLLGNYVSAAGGYTSVLRGVPEAVVPLPLWALLVVCGVVSTVVLTGLVVIAVVALVKALQARRELPITVWFVAHPGVSLAGSFVVVTMALYTVIPLVESVVVFDRYLLALVPIAAALVAWAGDRWHLTWPRTARIIGWSQVALFVFVSVLIVASTAALDGARWRLGTRLVQSQGLAAGNIDAGFDWFRAHTDGRAPAADHTTRWTWWTAKTGRAACITVMYANHPVDPTAAGPDSNAVVIATEDVWTLTGAPRKLVALAGPDECQDAVP